VVSVRLENLTKTFRSNVAVDNINLEVKDREFFVLLGPSGCGKSTTLNMIAGLEKPTSGNIYFDDELVNDIPPEKRDVAMVFQSFALYPTMNVFQNIAFPLTLRKLPKEEIRRRVKETAELLKIDSLLEKKPYELSGGEKQRVALARAVIRKPKLFLLDEPLSNIDAKLRVHMRAELIRLQKEIQTTTIYVTHDQVEAMTMGHRIAVMNNGRIVQVGAPLEVFNKPSNLFVAGFIGTPPMNFFNCRVKSIEGMGILEGQQFRIKLTQELHQQLIRTTRDGEVILGIRPQDLKISKEKLSPESFQAEVFAIEPLGTETIIDFQINGDVYKALTDTSFTGKIGDKIYITIPLEKAHFFSTENGNRIPA